MTYLNNSFRNNKKNKIKILKNKKKLLNIIYKSSDLEI